MPWYSYFIGAAIIIVFISSVVSFVKVVVQLINKKKHKNDPAVPETDVNDVQDKSNKEV